MVGRILITLIVDVIASTIISIFIVRPGNEMTDEDTDKVLKVIYKLFLVLLIPVYLISGFIADILLLIFTIGLAAIPVIVAAIAAIYWILRFIGTILLNKDKNQ